MGGLEGGIYAVRELWETLTQEAGDNPKKAFGTLLIDAKNAFNAANRTARLWNARILWPRASTFLFHCYRGDAELFLRGIHGTTTISSREGWTQGDPMSMARWSAGVAAGTEKKKQQQQEPDPLQKYWHQLWYADDASNTGWLHQLQAWLHESGPAAGYVVEVDKLILAVLPQFVQKAKEIFAEFPDL
uniref:Reverse transcriptase domain-containing protein n=1 Tax=Chromera velia CCMP2878 TaxID=1169474 RepID=A0A0G4G797_9ALVE|eukprot:Cvel_20480.t1-p1 / transcript=Cvel_20480.t1 / gene=Cvel_20480 / organism=Chromera_velia_CCMP2878 / gene_product=hypothetical protein / transcript_product=hypothetical protein / location=Cvel_scaffold1841:1997-3375(+) / protein_length=187 / sequence_SO=supercontig / SO=protein_coding / is_pseudo=false